jgi:hypothetical protein
MQLFVPLSQQNWLLCAITGQDVQSECSYTEACHETGCGQPWETIRRATE